jgi:hypothetical protein
MYKNIANGILNRVWCPSSPMNVHLIVFKNVSLADHPKASTPSPILLVSSFVGYAAKVLCQEAQMSLEISALPLKTQDTINARNIGEKNNSEELKAFNFL